MSFLISMAMGGLNWLKGLPWQVYAGVGVLLSLHTWGCVQYDNGRESVFEELRAAEAEAAAKAESARQSADENAQERAEEFETKQEALEDAIEQAESTGGNALDSIFAE